MTTTTNALPVYLAGKIKRSGWRNELFGTLIRDAAGEVIIPVRDGFAWNGPYFVGPPDEDHRVLTRTDILDPGVQYTCPEREDFGHGEIGCSCTGHNCEDCGKDQDDRAAIVTSCFSWLRSSRFVFAYLDGDAPYGTVLELGYAHAGEIPCFVAFGPNSPESLRRDTWLAVEAAREREKYHEQGQGEVFPDVLAAWDAFRWWHREFHPIEPAWRTTALLAGIHGMDSDRPALFAD